MRFAYSPPEVHELVAQSWYPLILFGPSQPCSGLTTQFSHPEYRVDRNLVLYLPRLTVLVTIEADRPEAWFPSPLGPYEALFFAI